MEFKDYLIESNKKEYYGVYEKDNFTIIGAFTKLEQAREHLNAILDQEQNPRKNPLGKAFKKGVGIIVIPENVYIGWSEGKNWKVKLSDHKVSFDYGEPVRKIEKFYQY